MVKKSSYIKFILFILFLTGGIIPSVSVFAESPNNVLKATVAKLKGARTITASFSTVMSGKRVNCSLKAKGNKFTMTSPTFSTWYDGKSMWSYSKSSGETTLWHPTASELAESNPLLYLSTAGNYTVSAGKGSTASDQVIVLTPKKRTTGVKNVTVTINTKTHLPKKLVLATSSGVCNVTISSLKLNGAVADTEFTYPKSRYPKVPITDLR